MTLEDDVAIEGISMEDTGTILSEEDTLLVWALVVGIQLNTESLVAVDVVGIQFNLELVVVGIQFNLELVVVGSNFPISTCAGIRLVPGLLRFWQMT